MRPLNLSPDSLFDKSHERGAFTAAFTQTTGRFRRADRGTVFLDEMGELPLELQPKLLRVLQKREFERVGSARTIEGDVRIIAATNLDLAQMVRERRFRADLYHRLNVFAISMPLLRDRAEDIPHLVWYFVRRFSGRRYKYIEVIPDEVVGLLQMHNWPGNIRELQNFFERSVILSSRPVLRPRVEELKTLSKAAERLGVARTTLLYRMRKLGITAVQQ